MKVSSPRHKHPAYDAATQPPECSMEEQPLHSGEKRTSVSDGGWVSRMGDKRGNITRGANPYIGHRHIGMTQRCFELNTSSPFQAGWHPL